MSAAALLQCSGLNSGLWSRSTALALLLHVAAFAAILVTLRGEIDDASGAPAIEISMESAAPREAEAPDAPPGPLTDESAAMAPSVASSEAKETQEEKITRTDAEDAELTRNEKPEKPVADERVRQSQQIVSSEFRPNRSDGDAEVRGRKAVGQACRSRAGR